MSQLVYKNKINKIRTFALSLVFIGIGIMYVGILARKIEWLMLTLFIIGLLALGFSLVVYTWIGLLSTKAVPVTCPSCKKPTKMLGRADACMHCRQPLTLDPSLEGKAFDEKYNRRSFEQKSSEE